MRCTIQTTCVAALISLSCPTSTLAQWAQQSLTLESGWNSVYLDVDPSPTEADELFEGLPIESVWMRCEGHRVGRPADGVDPSEDLASVAQADTGWCVWFPPHSPQHVVNSLRVVRGGRAYLIDASAPATLSVRGRPDTSVTQWQAGYNLAGFHVVEEAASAPTFSEYLQPSSTHHDAAIYKVNPDGTLSLVQEPESGRIASGKAYWVESESNTTYDGPIRIDRSSLRCVDLAPGIAEHRIQIENLRTRKGDVSIAFQPPLTGDGVEEAGRTPLLHLDAAAQEDSPFPGQWHPLNDTMLSLDATGQPGAVRTVRLAVNRKDLADRETDYAEDGYYHGLICVEDSSGYRRCLDVRTRGEDQTGLWVGDVTVTDVESLTTPGEGTETASPFTFRIIIHKSADGTYSLLRSVVLLWLDDGGGEGSHVLVTPGCEELLDGQSIAPRLSAPNFSFDGTVGLVGNFDTGLVAMITLPPDHPLDPYRHVYHPEHAYGFAGGIERTLIFVFDGDGGGDPEWGATALGGTYIEDITGLHREMIRVSGRFEIRKVSPVASLCGS
ncbi:MAG: hypothetical protein JSU63_14980 [Phycisphaerales bacterium]|nr:MAG: hypothetical protein JSU63_14980 [Phycisphaerales bacterium]